MVASVTEADLVERLDRAIGESSKVINVRAAEIKELSKPVGPQVSEAQQASEEHMSRPMTSLDTGRLGRI